MESSVQKTQLKLYDGPEILEFIGKEFSELENSPFFKKHPETQAPMTFKANPTKTGTPKGVFYTCKELGIQIFALDLPNNTKPIDFIDLYSLTSDKNYYPYIMPHGLQLQ